MGFQRRSRPTGFRLYQFPFCSTWIRVNVLGCVGLLRILGMVRWHDDAAHGQTIEDECSTAHPQGNHLSKIVQPHTLRAPEVILGLEWGPAIDIWSLGCLV